MALDDHAPDGILEQYSLGTLADSEAEHLEEHLLLCEQCRNRLEQTDVFVEAVRQAAMDLQLEPPTGWAERCQTMRRWTMRLAPASLALAALVALVVAVPLYRKNAAAHRPAMAVLLEANRGAPGQAAAPSGRALVLALDGTGLPQASSYEVEIVDSSADLILTAQGRPADGRVRLQAPKLHAGVYWVRMFDPGRKHLLREFGLTVR